MDQYKHSHSEGNSRLWLSIAIVVVLTAVAIFMVPDQEPEQVEAIPLPGQIATRVTPGTEKAPQEERQTRKPQAASPEEQAQPPAAPEKVPPAAPSGPEGSAARAFLASAENAGIDPEELVAKAREFQQQGLAGDAWLLYFKAAREGDASAAMALAEQADPEFFDPASSALSEPDLVQAHKWYRVAEKAGSDEAAQRLGKLYERLQRAAENGDERAGLLLQKWKAR